MSVEYTAFLDWEHYSGLDFGSSKPASGNCLSYLSKTKRNVNACFAESESIRGE